MSVEDNITQKEKASRSMNEVSIVYAPIAYISQEKEKAKVWTWFTPSKLVWRLNGCSFISSWVSHKFIKFSKGTKVSCSTYFGRAFHYVFYSAISTSSYIAQSAPSFFRILKLPPKKCLYIKAFSIHQSVGKEDSKSEVDDEECLYYGNCSLFQLF